MNASPVQVLNVVALTRDVEAHGLVRGQVGTVVEQLEEHVFEVEFADDSGQTYAQIPLPDEILLVLHYRPCAA